jgi:hypothetical protein
MIGRTLSRIFSVGKMIGKNYHSPHDYTLLDICEAFNGLFLPVRAMRIYAMTGKRTGEKERVVYEDIFHFSRFEDYDDNIKRVLTKAFDKRRKVKVGETFYLSKARAVRRTRVGYKVNRIDRNTIEVSSEHRYICERYLVSSSREDLLKYERPGFTPIHYRFVLF